MSGDRTERQLRGAVVQGRGGERGAPFKRSPPISWPRVAGGKPETNTPWTHDDLVIVVDDYLEMLVAQVAGERYNKSAHRRRLRELLPARSDGSIEFKRANISAVLEAMGLDYIDGCKPRRNVQEALYEVVCQRAEHAHDRLAEVRQQLETGTWNLPATLDPKRVLVQPPKLAPPSAEERQRAQRWLPRLAQLIDWTKVEARNRSLGRAGEKFVLPFERERLERAGKPRLARSVRHVAEHEGDGAGYDVLSFDVNGQEKFIEVKTTVSGPVAPFHVSRNELETYGG